MASFKTSSLFAITTLVVQVAAHGHVDWIITNGVAYRGNPTQFPVAGWITGATDNGYVEPNSFSDPDIICHRAARNARGHIAVSAGDKISLKWNDWPSSHKGPVIDYLAKCPGNCQDADKNDLEFFKIGEEGLIDLSKDSGHWASDVLISNGNSWTLQIPSALASGNYVLRHEIIALHGAGQRNGAQNYPQCFNIKVTEGGNVLPEGVKGTALYKSDDPGILFDLYVPRGSLSYDIPGPTLSDSTPTGDIMCGPVHGLAKYSQCGGKNYVGQTVCAWGATCQVVNEYYWQSYKMVGVPTSRGCGNCRKAKKKAWPSCVPSQDTLLTFTSVTWHSRHAGAVREYAKAVQGAEFHQYNPVTAPKTTPSNETTKLAAEFVDLIGITDERYSFEIYGPRFFKTLPQRFGSHPVLDDMTSAVIASFQSVRLRKQSSPRALSLFGKALRSLQECLNDPKQPVTFKLELVIMVMLCQLWIDNKSSNKHRGIIAHLLEEAVTQRQIIDSNDLRGFCLQGVYAALSDPNVELGSWYWDVALQDPTQARPHHYEQGLYCFELCAIGDLPVFLRDPERYLYQLKCYWNTLSTERPMMRHKYEMAIPMALAPNATFLSRLKAIEYASGHAILLIQAALIGPTIKPFGVLPAYTEKSHQICDEAITLAQQCQAFRPCGSSWAAELLKMVWAALDDGYRNEELEELMDRYAEDVQGADYLGEAKNMRNRFDRLGWSNNQRFLTAAKDGQDASPPCVIL
ncbi:unnamed protein product [Fusarium graminearum]|nr:unnamed protein product [Fusarium graminearum]